MDTQTYKDCYGNDFSIDKEQRLYNLPVYDGRGKVDGYTCLGFDVCLKRSKGLAAWLGVMFKDTKAGSPEAYQEYMELCHLGALHADSTGNRCPVELTTSLIGLEGKRVEVVDCYGEKRRFWVGKSTGWMPCHLEICRRNSSGGLGVMGTPFKSVRVVNDTRR